MTWPRRWPWPGSSTGPRPRRRPGAAAPALRSAARIGATRRRSWPSRAATAVGLGILHFRRRLNFTTFEGWISELFVRPEARGRGIGRALLDALIAEWRLRGGHRLQIQVPDQAAAAEAMLSRCRLRGVDARLRAAPGRSPGPGGAAAGREPAPRGRCRRRGGNRPALRIRGAPHATAGTYGSGAPHLRRAPAPGGDWRGPHHGGRPERRRGRCLQPGVARPVLDDRDARLATRPDRCRIGAWPGDRVGAARRCPRGRGCAGGNAAVPGIRPDADGGASPVSVRRLHPDGTDLQNCCGPNGERLPATPPDWQSRVDRRADRQRPLAVRHRPGDCGARGTAHP